MNCCSCWCLIRLIVLRVVRCVMMYRMVFLIWCVVNVFGFWFVMVWDWICCSWCWVSVWVCSM